jgi:hypothetical protein
VTDEPRKNERKTRGKPFGPGNPGKPKGARHKTTLLAEKLMQDDAADVVKKVIAAAKGGDMTAARIVLDRIAPARRDSPVTIALPKIESAADAAKAMASVLDAVAGGAMTPGEAEQVAKLIDTFARTLEVTEFEERLRALEVKAKETLNP